MALMVSLLASLLSGIFSGWMGCRWVFLPLRPQLQFRYGSNAIFYRYGCLSRCGFMFRVCHTLSDTFLVFGQLVLS